MDTSDARIKTNFNTYHLAFRQVRMAFRTWLLTAFFWALVWVTPLIAGLVVRAVFDELTGAATASIGLWGLLALLAGLALARVAGISGGIWTIATFLLRASGRIRRNMFESVLARPGADAIPGSPGEAISRFGGDVRELEWATEWFVDLPGVIITTIVSLAVMAAIDPLVTAVVFAPMLAIFFVITSLRKKILEYRAQARKTHARVVGFIAETFGSVQAVKVATAERNVIRYFEQLNEARRHASLKDTLLSEMMFTIFKSTINLGIGIVLLLAGESIRQGSFTVGDFALFIAYMWPLTDAMFAFGNMIARHNQAQISLERLKYLLMGTPEETLIKPGPIYMDGTLPAVPVHHRAEGGELETLEVEGLSYLYPENGRGVRAASFRIERGSLTVVTGRIGSGKTTLLRSVLGLLPARGRLIWNGVSVEDPVEFFNPPRAAYTPQVPRLFSESLHDNIVMGQPTTDGEVNLALRKAVFEQDLEGMEHGLETLVGPRGVRLSGGQVQRTSAARMFVTGADLLVFDDLSSALDVETEQKLWERIFDEPEPAASNNGAPSEETRSRPACLVVSHRRAVLQRADNIIVLKEGQVEAQGRLEELLETCPEMRRLWEGDIEG